MTSIERDKIAPRLRRYYANMKREMGGRDLRDLTVEKEVQAAAQPGDKFLYNDPSPFSYRAYTFKLQGLKGLMEGDLEALALLCQSVYYDTAYLCCCSAEYLTNKVQLDLRGERFNEVALLLARALTLGCWREADIIANIIRLCLKERRMGNGQINYAFYFIETSCVAPFLLDLYTRWQGESFPLRGLPLAPLREYEPLLALWQTEDLAALEDTLLTVCDAHMKHSKYTQVDIKEFELPADILYPVEILAVLRLRETRGLPNPVIDHPLLNTLVGRLYEIKSVPHEEVMDKALANYLSTFPATVTERLFS